MSYSLVNLYEFSNGTLFDDITIPSGIDKEILVNTIFDTCEELEPIIFNVPLFKAKVETFFKRNYNAFNRLYEASLLEYEPIENYDKTSSINTEYTGVNTNTGNGSNTISDTNNSTDTNKVSAFDTEGFSNSSQTESSNTNNSTQNESRNFTNTDNDTTVVSERTHGNIGVTTSQQMLQSEIDLWSSFNIYAIISEKFMFELMITCM